MSIDSTNPAYAEFLEDWVQMRDTYGGERIVKRSGTKYLPATQGMIADGMTYATQPGYQAYDAYRARARFPDVTKDAVEALIGIMHRKPPQIELPERMEFLRENATVQNESLVMLLRRINEEQLVSGRLGLLGDVADTGARRDEPYISIYQAESVINWDEGRSDGIEIQNLNLVVLDETEDERVSGFEWERQQKYRVLVLAPDESPESLVEIERAGAQSGGDGDAPVVNLPSGMGIYRMGVFRDNATSFDPSSMLTPRIRGAALEGSVPFVFINAKDVTAQPDLPPLLGLSNLALGIYRGEADYRQSLFMQGQDTLVVIGGEEDRAYRIGAGASISVPVAGDAKFIGVDSAGLSEQRLALENDYRRAGQRGGELLDMLGSGTASGEALRIRVAARTATVTQLALAGAFGLQAMLRILARWMRLDPEAVLVTPNLDFADDRMASSELVQAMTAKTLGAPWSLRSIHVNMQERGLTDMSYEDELEELGREAPLTQGSSDPDGPEADEPEDDSEDDPNGSDDGESEDPEDEDPKADGE